MWGVIKRDLSEFVSTVKTETKDAVISAVKKEENDKHNGKPSRKRIPFNASIIQETPALADKVAYENFSNKFDVGAKTSEISKLLKEDMELKNLHAELVPDNLEYKQFWLRYYFLNSKVSKPSTTLDLDVEDEEEDLGWDQEEDEEEPSSPISAPNEASEPSLILNHEKNFDEMETKYKMLLSKAESREKEQTLQIERLQNDKSILEAKVKNLEQELKHSQSKCDELESATDSNRGNVISRADLICALKGEGSFKDPELASIVSQVLNQRKLTQEHQEMQSKIVELSNAAAQATAMGDASVILPPTQEESRQTGMVDSTEEMLPSADVPDVDRANNNDSPSSSGSDLVKVERDADVLPKDEESLKATEKKPGVNRDELLSKLGDVEKEGDEEWDDWS